MVTIEAQIDEVYNGFIGFRVRTDPKENCFKQMVNYKQIGVIDVPNPAQFKKGEKVLINIEKMRRKTK